jgi:hypothetical protein
VVREDLESMKIWIVLLERVLEQEQEGLLWAMSP